MTAARHEVAQSSRRGIVASGLAVTAALIVGTVVADMDDTVPDDQLPAGSLVRPEVRASAVSTGVRDLVPPIARRRTTTAFPPAAPHGEVMADTSPTTNASPSGDPQPARIRIEPQPDFVPRPKPNSTSGQEPAVEPARGEMWDRLARCESGHGGEPRWGIDNKPHLDPYSEARFYGGLQFNKESWDWAVESAGHDVPAWPHEASREQQIMVAETLLDIHPAGWGAWPVCSRKVGLR